MSISVVNNIEKMANDYKPPGLLLKIPKDYVKNINADGCDVHLLKTIGMFIDYNKTKSTKMPEFPSNKNITLGNTRRISIELNEHYPGTFLYIIPYYKINDTTTSFDIIKNDNGEAIRGHFHVEKSYDITEANELPLYFLHTGHHYVFKNIESKYIDIDDFETLYQALNPNINVDSHTKRSIESNVITSYLPDLYRRNVINIDLPDDYEGLLSVYEEKRKVNMMYVLVFFTFWVPLYIWVFRLEDVYTNIINGTSDIFRILFLFFVIAICVYYNEHIIN